MKRYCALSVCLLLCASCAVPPAAAPPSTPSAAVVASEIPPPRPSDREEWIALLDEVNAKNAALDAPTADLDQYKYDYSSGEPLFTAEDNALIEGLHSVTAFPQTISRADAKTEVDWYFRLLRTRYGPYTFYGGDEVFAAARETLLAQLDAGSEPLRVKEDYAPMLCAALEFIRDNHFTIGDTKMGPKTVLVGNPGVTFLLRGGAYYGGENKDREVTAVEGGPPQRYLKPTIGMDGALTQCLYTQLPEHNVIKTVTVTYRDGGEERVTLQQALANAGGPRPQATCHISQEDSIYTVQMNRMVMGSREDGPYTAGDDVLKEQFLRTATALEDYSAAIFDLRYNSGGNGNLPGEWFTAYTGEAFQPNYSKLALRRALDGSWPTPEKDARWSKPGWVADGDYYVQRPTPQFVDGAGPLLLVRTGSSTASAAEGFTDMARNLKNTLVVGAPTGGVLTANMSYFDMAMPWSKLAFSYGTNLYYWDSGYFAEGRGLAPDLYLTGNDTDARLALFLARYLPYYGMD